MEFLKTKLFMPPIPAAMVPRPRLVKQLRKGLTTKRLTLISAPAGFGKTTLLSECFGSAKYPVGWVSLDEDDNDPTRFWSYFIAALQGTHPNIGDTAIRLLRSPQPPATEILLTELLDELIDCSDTLGQPCVIVLDDYDVIDNTHIHKGLAFFVDRMPPQMHIVISARGHVPLMDRLRNRDQISELRTGDLRFTPGEANSLLSNLTGIALPEKDMAALDAHTEGWAMCLKMAGLCMRGRTDIQSFVAAFANSHQPAIDYLSEELLARQTDAVQSFLLRTSILSRLNGPLCNAVVGHGKSAKMLSWLEESNLFITPLDRERTWYTYHSLFASLLQRRLHQLEHSRVKTLHSRASQWFERKGLTDGAISHALGAGDYHRAASLIEDVAEATFMRGEIATFLSWAEALPDGVIVCRPRLCAFIAWALLLSGSPLTAIEEHLKIATEIDSDSLASGEVAVLRALMAALEGDAKQSSELADLALKLLPHENRFLRDVLACNLGLVYLLTGDVRAAQPVFEEAIRVGRDTGNLMLSTIGMQRMAELYVAQGRLQEARAFYDWMIEVAVNPRGHILPIASTAFVGLADLLREWNDLEAAQYCLEEGIGLMTEWQDGGAVLGYAVLAQIKQARSDLAGAREAIRQAREMALALDITEADKIQMAAIEARLHIVWGELKEAEQWVEESGLTEGSGLSKASGHKHLPYAVHELQHITLARLLIALGLADHALEVLDPWLTKANELGRIGSVIHILILKALAFDARGDTARATHSLRRAIYLAQPGGYVRLFADEGETMARLLRRTGIRGAVRKYVKHLMDAI